MTLSTDLGASPQVAPAVAPARAAANDVLGSIGQELGSAIGNSVNRSRLETANTEFNDLADEAIEAEQSVADTELIGPPAARGTREVELLDTVRTLQAGVDQATGSRRQSLELELRRKVEELGNKHPHLRAAYATELSRFERTDPEVQALGMMDAGDASFSAQSAKQLADIMQHAQGSVASGGLGMDPAKKIDLNWSREYTFKRDVRELTNNNQTTLTALQSGDALDARSSADNFQASLQGQGNQVQGMVREAMDMSIRVGTALKDPTAQGASETIAEWNSFGRDAVLQDLNMAVFQIEDSFANIPISQANTDAYNAAKSLKDDQVGALNVLIEGVTSDVPNIVSAYEAYETMQKINFERKNPAFVADARVMLELAPILEHIDADFGAQGDILRNDLAGFLNQGLSSVLGRSLGHTRNADLLPNASVADLQDHYRDIRTGAGSMYDNGQTTTAGIQTMAVTDAELKASQAFLKMVEVDGLSPNVAAAAIGAQGANFDQYLSAGTTQEDGLEAAFATMQDPNWLKMAEVALTSNQPAVSQYLGDQAQAIALRYEPHRINKYNDLRGTEVHDGIFAAQVISPDFSSIKKGEVSFRVDESLIRRTIGNSPSFTPGRSLEIESSIAIREAQRVAQALSQAVSRDLRSGAHAAALAQGIDTVSYRGQWDFGRFDEFFGDAVE